MQVHRPSGRTESDASEGYVTESASQLVGQSEGDGVLPGWAVRGELESCDDHGDKAVSRHSASDSHLPASLPQWAAKALAGKTVPLTSTSIASFNTIQLQEGSSDESVNNTSLDDSKPSKPGTRATWGPVEAPVITSQVMSVTDSNVGPESGAIAQSISAESLSVPSVSEESIKVVDRPGMQVFPSELVGSHSDTSVPLPKASVKFAEKTTSLHGSDMKLADQMLLSASSASCDLVDIELEDELVSELSDEGSLSNDGKRAEQLRKIAAYQSVSQESAESTEQRHVQPVDNQHISKETVSTDERYYVKLVPNQFVGSETTQVDDRTHLRMSSSVGATTESEETPERALLKPVEGQHISAETSGENTAKPCIRMNAERYATKETESTLPSVCFMSAL